MDSYSCPMGKGKIILILVIVLAIVMPIGGLAYDVASEECSQSPSGVVHFELLRDGWAQFQGEEIECNPWQVVEPETGINSITFVGHDIVHERTSRLRLDRDLGIVVSETMGSFSSEQAVEKTEILARSFDKDLAAELIAKLSLYVGHNQNLSYEETKELCPGEEGTCGNHGLFRTSSKTICRSRIEYFTAPTLSSEILVEYENGTMTTVDFDFPCSSMALEIARSDFSSAYTKAEAAAGFDSIKYYD